MRLASLLLVCASLAACSTQQVKEMQDSIAKGLAEGAGGPSRPAARAPAAPVVWPKPEVLPTLTAAQLREKSGAPTDAGVLRALHGRFDQNGSQPQFVTEARKIGPCKPAGPGAWRCDAAWRVSMWTISPGLVGAPPPQPFEVPSAYVEQVRFVWDAKTVAWISSDGK